MKELLKFLKTLKAKGFALKSEKENVKALFKGLEDEEKEIVEDAVNEATALPEDNPKDADDEQKALKTIKDFVGVEVETKVAKIKSELSQEVADFKAEQKELAKKNVGTGEKSVREARSKMNGYLRQLSKSVLEGDIATIKELTTGDAGADIVDSELSAEIRNLITEFGVARREFFTTQLSKNAYDANALTTDVAISWVDEAGVIPTVSVALTQTELKLKKLAAIAVISRELLDDEEIDLLSFIGQRVAEGFSKAEDTAFFNGGGTGTDGGFTGLLQVTAIPEVEIATKADITVEKVFELIDALPTGAHDGAKFYFHRTVLTQIRLLKDGDGRYIYQNPFEASGVPTLAGYPVVLVEALPTFASADLGLALFGNLNKTAILGFKGGISLDRTNSAVVRNQANDGDINTFTTDREAIRWVTRVGYIVILPTACVRLVAEA